MQPSAYYPEAQRISHTLQDTYNGNAWHGPSVGEVLKDVTAAEASLRPISSGHSIWELVLHMTSWRIFTWNKLAGDPSFDITDPAHDWPPVKEDSQLAWEAARLALENSQQQLLIALENFPDERLMQIVPGRSYDYYKLLQRNIGHDLYHTGQMALLKKMLRKS